MIFAVLELEPRASYILVKFSNPKLFPLSNIYNFL